MVDIPGLAYWRAQREAGPPPRPAWELEELRAMIELVAATSGDRDVLPPRRGPQEDIPDALLDFVGRAARGGEPGAVKGHSGIRWQDFRRSGQVEDVRAHGPADRPTMGEAIANAQAGAELMRREQEAPGKLAIEAGIADVGKHTRFFAPLDRRRMTEEQRRRLDEIEGEQAVRQQHDPRWKQLRWLRGY
jgi:hypothetical protein